MRVREQTYWEWADAQLHSRCHDEVLSDGTVLDIRAVVAVGCHAIVSRAICWKRQSPAGGVLSRAPR